MGMLGILLVSAGLLVIAWFTYGPVLVRLLRLDPNKVTPAVELNDGNDYDPIEPSALLSQHFSAIAAAGPIVGPIAAGVAFGWLPALIWILVGSIFIGGVHDLMALVASVRHRAHSIAEVVREHISRRAFLLFLSFVWLALVYIVVAFTDFTALAFVGQSKLEDGSVVAGAAIASSSLMYLAIPVVMGVCLRYGKMPLGLATAIFLPLVGLSIYAGPYMPIDVEEMLLNAGLASTPAEATSRALVLWDLALLFYCCIASMTPMWLLLQPRGHLGGYFLYVALLGGGVGLLIGAVNGTQQVEYPAFTGWLGTNGQMMFPFLFTTIACGACSGFHALIASGTTSKQLRKETDAKVIGYGAMLLEAMVAVISLCCVIRLARGNELLQGQPNLIYARGLGAFLETFAIPSAYAVSFALMAFTTFVYDTLDVCTRLGRYIIQELTGWRTTSGRWFATILSAGTPALFVTQQMTDANGKAIPAWKVFWQLFGASNQLLAALTLLAVTVWLWQTRRAWWVWLVAGIPTVWMYVMSLWALVVMTSGTWKELQMPGGASTAKYLVLSVSILLIVLAALMLFEGLLALTRRRGDTSPEPIDPIPPLPLRQPTIHEDANPGGIPVAT